MDYVFSLETGLFLFAVPWHDGLLPGVTIDVSGPFCSEKWHAIESHWIARPTDSGSHETATVSERTIRRK